MLRKAVVVAAMVFIPTVALALMPHAPPAGPGVVLPASQTVDPCYKRCFLDAKGKNGAWQSRCRRICNANPKKQCEDRCWLKNGNDPKGRRACLTRCS